MVYTREDFHARVGNVDKQQSRLVRRGYTTRIDKNGVIVAKPKAMRIRLPIKGAVLLVLSFFCFKAFMLAANGPDTYQDRLATLESGNAAEAFGASVLAIDPVTQYIADQMGPLLR
ncbi:hypothetical protein [Sulfitobacter donghicola]|uniref:Uncharacterized protein n=1 Tax=Sulfitobacter donghicola DSW-25 = KCTC 12864 = JCM 14565 TaxID=1300350 RepID=A0A073IF74_9RHOB|nr:hypothetical protein [Sulfitobacter donghicola]KEJ88220.1 hypothetical protein DSW25_16225 [Sulfitobacter donghicola DSW-25 = KCTC 12864 = JCM 14565]KIN68814.1 hypothetical protein Z948_2546 [Sulfitobacter donghicola DSW-25 = KCTC 12864 = JCM 14565]